MNRSQAFVPMRILEKHLTLYIARVFNIVTMTFPQILSCCIVSYILIVTGTKSDNAFENT